MYRRAAVADLYLDVIKTVAKELKALCDLTKKGTLHAAIERQVP